MDSSIDEGSNSGPSPNRSMDVSPDVCVRQKPKRCFSIFVITLCCLIASRRVVIFDEENLATNEVIKEEVRRILARYPPFVGKFIYFTFPCQEYGRKN